mmetsp:Transcript_59711/g.139770  ORF Transcript_59711/g.139770 Transcript_59711/m.139770 type:complete len:283 (+) Transcript_59711:84-932(+)
MRNLQNTAEAMPKEKQTLFVGQFRKTKMCRFHETGRCRYGDECPFAHDPSELEELPDLRKTSICKNWQQGRCSHASERCPFAHGKEELRKTPPFGRKRSGQGEAFARKDSFEGSDAYASTSEGYRSGSGYFTDIDRQSSSSFDEEPASPARQQLLWDPLGPVAEAPANCAPKNFDIGQDLDQSWRQGLSQQIADRSRVPMRTGFDHPMIAAVPAMAGMQRPDATQGYMMEGGVVPAMPGHFVLMPAMHLSPPVMWDRTTPYSPSGKELEEMLRKAMPTHYDD